MTTVSQPAEHPQVPPRVRGVTSPGARFVWSVRRELWEHRAVYVAPTAVAGLIVAGAILSALHMVRVRTDINAPPDAAGAVRLVAFSGSAVAILAVSIVVAFFYCIAALNGEKRDRSILFWKSLPVSDVTAVLAKAAVPLLVTPAFTFVLVVVLQTVLLILAALGVMVSGVSPGIIGADLHLPEMWLFLLYLILVVTLWYAPVYAWLLMVSAWSKRAPFLWAVLPPLAVAAVERLTLNTSVVANLLHERAQGFKVGFSDAGLSGMRSVPGNLNPLALADPQGLLTSPGLWGGLIAAAVFLGAAVWLRRSRDPV